MGRKLYQNKFSTGSRRMPNWDYTKKAYYSITINTKKKGNIFGEILNGTMILNALGKIADEYAIEIPKHFSHVKLHEYIVMPNHVHLLLEIFKKPDVKKPLQNIKKFSNGKTQHCCVSRSKKLYIENFDRGMTSNIETEHCSVPPLNENIASSTIKYHHKVGSISVIVRSYKSICTREIHKLNGQKYFKWQSSFYDQVIFDEQYFQNTLFYIRNNPKNPSQK